VTVCSDENFLLNFIFGFPFCVHIFLFFFNLTKYFNGIGYSKGVVKKFEEYTGLYEVVFEHGQIEYIAETALEKILMKPTTTRGASITRKQVSAVSEDDDVYDETDDDDDDDDDFIVKKKRKSGVSQESAKKSKKTTPVSTPKPKLFKRKYDDGTKVVKVSLHTEKHVCRCG
jgi:hypothetical protein